MGKLPAWEQKEGQNYHAHKACLTDAVFNALNINIGKSNFDQ